MTTAFTQLEREGHLVRHDNDIALQGEPPSDFQALATTLPGDHEQRAELTADAARSMPSGYVP